jgi:hypothetical protein
MAKVICNVCGERKDKDEEYYKSNPSTCKDCWKKRCNAVNKDVKNRTLILLTEILGEQREFRVEISSSMADLDARMKKLEKAMKKLLAKDD